MYSTCSLCRRRLGTNTTLPHIPIGRRLAFERQHGRVWVICPRCGEWNLTPLEDRWEALEECEAAFILAQSRAVDTEVGLARLTDGTELLRIGPGVTRSDVANWRYGQRLHRRRGRAIFAVAVAAGITLAGASAVYLASASTPVALWTGAFLAGWLFALPAAVDWRALARYTPPGRSPVTIRASDLPRLRLRFTAAGHAMLILPDGRKELRVSGDEAAALLAALLPHLNATAAGPADIAAAVRRVDQAEAAVPAHPTTERAAWERVVRAKTNLILEDAPLDQRLALEMAVTEACEIRSLLDTAIRLKPRWGPAERIAAIADDLLVPDWIRTWIAKHRDSKAGDSAV